MKINRNRLYESTLKRKFIYFWKTWKTVEQFGNWEKRQNVLETPETLWNSWERHNTVCCRCQQLCGFWCSGSRRNLLQVTRGKILGAENSLIKEHIGSYWCNQTLKTISERTLISRESFHCQGQFNWMIWPRPHTVMSQERLRSDVSLTCVTSVLVLQVSL